MAALLLHHLLRTSPIEATLIFATARVLDAVVSPLMGFHR
jgi:Na+/melibiose symporter-like transporter